MCKCPKVSSRRLGGTCCSSYERTGPLREVHRTRWRQEVRAESLGTQVDEGKRNADRTNARWQDLFRERLETSQRRDIHGTKRGPHDRKHLANAASSRPRSLVLRVQTPSPARLPYPREGANHEQIVADHGHERSHQRPHRRNHFDSDIVSRRTEENS